MIELLDWLLFHKEFSGSLAIALCFIGYFWIPNHLSIKFGEKHSHYECKCAKEVTLTTKT